MIEENNFAIMSPEFAEQVRKFREDWFDFYQNISKEETPTVDGSGQRIVDRRPDGKDYIIEAYMRSCLDKHFPGWSWEMAAPIEFLGGEWCVAQGHLRIGVDEIVAQSLTQIRCDRRVLGE